MKKKPASRLVRRSFGEGGSASTDGRVLVILLFCGAACFTSAVTLVGFFRADTPMVASQRTLTFQERVVYQRAIEEVYWRHRIWPRIRDERPDPKPSLAAVMSQAQLELKVQNYLRESQELGDYWQRPITAADLQAEMERMAQYTKQPDVLRELFEALGNDPFIIAECLARPVLSKSLIKDLYAHDPRLHDQLKRQAESWQRTAESQTSNMMAAVRARYGLPIISGGGRMH